MGSELSRRRLLAAATGALVFRPGAPRAQEGVFARAEETPRLIFPEATAVAARTVPATADLQAAIRARLGRAPTAWEPAYAVFDVAAAGAPLGQVVVVEEVGKHRPITFAVGVTPDGRVRDVIVLAYREPYGGEVRDRRFLAQYRGKGATDPLQPSRDVRNVAGATLSVQATGRAIKKAIAVLQALGAVS